MGITGLIPFLEKASRKTNISEFSGCSVAIDSYCWLHKGAFACAEKLVLGEETDIHIKYCLKYVTMLLSKNIKPILVFDGRHLPAKALTEAKRRESRNISKKRAAELLTLGKTEEARSYMRRSVDITHTMALSLMKECRNRNVDCIVAPYEADAQLAYLNIKNIAHVVITEDSDLLLFGCNRVFFKMDLDGAGTLIEASKLPLAMRCPIERYSFSKFRQMCIMSGCDYLSSLPGIGLAKARQFINATHDPNIANALKKLPSYFNKSQIIVSDEYREGFLKAEATFKHQYVYDPLTREMVRLTETEDEDTEIGLCSNAGEILAPKVALQLALGNLDPFTMKKVDNWNPDDQMPMKTIKSDSWKQPSLSSHPSMWQKEFHIHLDNPCPWKKAVRKLEPIITKPTVRSKKKVVNLVTKFVPETEDVSLTIENLSNMYCIEPVNKKPKFESESQLTELEHNIALTENAINADLTQTQTIKSPILNSKYRKFHKDSLKKLSSFPRTVLGDNLVESKFFNSKTEDGDIEPRPKSPVLTPDSKRNPFKVKQAIYDKKGTESQVINEENDTGEISPNSRINIYSTKTKMDSNDEIEPDNENFIKVSPDSKGNNFRFEKTKNSYDNIQVIHSKTINNNKNILSQDNKRIFNIKPVMDSEIIKEYNTLKKMNNSDDIIKLKFNNNFEEAMEIDIDKENSTQKENLPQKSPILDTSRNIFVGNDDVKCFSEDIIENTYPMESLVTPVDSQESFGTSPIVLNEWRSKYDNQGSIRETIQISNPASFKKSTCKVPGLRKPTKALPSNQPTLLSKFGFQKRPAMKK